jgi:hypothetical protein
VEGRRYCSDQPDGIPHLVDEPRAHRCDQHRAQRHHWSDANRYRKKAGLPLLPWTPDPLTVERCRDALRLTADYNARIISQIARDLAATIRRLDAPRNRLSTEERQYLIVSLGRLEADANALTDIAHTMGWPFPVAPPTTR